MIYCTGNQALIKDTIRVQIDGICSRVVRCTLCHEYVDAAKCNVLSIIR